MIPAHTLDQLKTLRLDGMAAALTDQASSSAAAALGFEDRLALLVQREIDWRDGKRLARLLKAARLKVGSACIEEIVWRDARNLDRRLITALAGGDWVRQARTVLMTGATGTGKTWLACALARQAARCGFTVLYARTTRLMNELHVAHGDGSCSTTSPARRWTPAAAPTCWSCSTIASARRPPSSPARWRSTSGTPGSTTRRWPTRSSTASCTARTASS